MTVARVPAEIPRITVEEIQGLLKAGGEVVILDVRSHREFDWMHIAGAQSVLPEQIGQLKLPPEAAIAIY